MKPVLLIVPTLNAGALWQSFIEGVKLQTAHSENDLKVLVIDSGSTDETVKLALNAGFEVHSIEPSTFDHGGTRQRALDIASEGRESEHEFALFMTQDAVFTDPKSLQALMKPFEDPLTALVYGRQLPHEGATELAAQARSFNYPELSMVKRYEDRSTLGIKTAFCSNSFAMYRIHALQEVGGFPLKTIMGEDMFVAAKLLKAGYQVAYEAQAHVFHSHNYTHAQEFKRYFDTGVFHAESQSILKDFGGVGGEGMRLLRAQLKLSEGLLGFAKWVFVFDVIARNALKYIAYQLGRHHYYLPLMLKKHLSMFKGHWSR